MDNLNSSNKINLITSQLKKQISFLKTEAHNFLKIANDLQLVIDNLNHQDLMLNLCNYDDTNSNYCTIEQIELDF